MSQFIILFILFSMRIRWAHESLPSSRTFLIGEQPNAWQLLHRRAKVSRHRGAELRRRYELLGGTSLFILMASI